MIIPLMIPDLPTLDEIAPYFRRIDAKRWYSNFGPLVQELESRLATSFAGTSPARPQVVTVSNCTAGIELALRALNLPAGSQVLVPALTFVATATAVASAGLAPIVADIDPGTWLLTPDIARDALAQTKISAIVPVATFGCPQDGMGWRHFHADTGVPVVIDAAAGFGNQVDPGPTCAVFSLHATKPLAAGEGGFVVTESPTFAASIRQRTNFGINLTDATAGPIGTTTMIGTNAKMSEYHAAVALASLDRWPANAAHRRRLFNQYSAMIRSIARLPTTWQRGVEESVRSLCCFLFDSSLTRDWAESQLGRSGIATRRWYLPAVDEHAAFRRFAHLPTPVTDDIGARLLGVPFYPALDPASQAAVVNALQRSAE